MKSWQTMALLSFISIALSGCMLSKVVTVPVKVAYGTTKAVVKGTAAVAGAVIPDGDSEQDEPKD